MRLVLDTNVLIAAFVSRGACHELLEHCQRDHRLVTSGVLLRELHSKLIEKIKAPRDRARSAVDLIRSHAENVEPAPLEPPVCRDPDDDWVLATASAGRCACIVTGDGDLLTLQRHQAIAIIPPNKFWEFEASFREG